MDYSRYLPYLDNSIDKLLDNFQADILQKTTPERCLKIRDELKIYLEYLKKLKDQNPDKVIDDHIGAILCSFMLDPNLSIMDRDAHYNGCWHALWGVIHGQKLGEVKAICSKKNPNDERWTQVCLSAVEEYYNINTRKPLFGNFKGRSRK